MGWGTDFTIDMFINRQVFNTPYEVRDKLNDVEQEISKTETMLISYSCSSPKDIAGEEWKDDPISHINYLFCIITIPFHGKP